MSAQIQAELNALFETLKRSMASRRFAFVRAPAKVDAVALHRRRVEHGHLSVGLKIHCMGDGSLEERKNSRCQTAITANGTSTALCHAKAAWRRAVVWYLASFCREDVNLISKPKSSGRPGLIFK
jgi:aminopeptidase-like protein